MVQPLGRQRANLVRCPTGQGREVLRCAQDDKRGRRPRGASLLRNNSDDSASGPAAFRRPDRRPYPSVIVTLFSTSPCLIESTTSCPLRTCPKTVCLPSSQSVAMCVMKNWLPFVFGPALAIDSEPFWWRRGLFLTSSANLYPGPPLPVPCGSPPWTMKSAITRWNLVPS